MWYVERSKGDGIWVTFMASPHRIGIDDIRSPPDPSPKNQTAGGFYLNSSPSPGNKPVFAGRRGWKARVRHNDSMVEQYDWDRVPVNEFDPDTDYLWGWKLTVNNRDVVPFQDLWPLRG